MIRQALPLPVPGTLQLTRWMLLVITMSVLGESAAFGLTPASVGRGSTVLPTTRQSPIREMVSGGFSFDDGEQVLVSVQKPLGILLEQDEDDNTLGPVVVAEVDPSGSAGRAGVMEGDILVAVQNASVENQSLEYVMDFLQQTPRVVNLRFIRP